MKRLLMIPLIVLLAGCGGAPTGANKAGAAGGSNATPAKSTATEAIEGFTGKTAVDAGQRAKAKLKQIDADRQKDIEEAEK